MNLPERALARVFPDQRPPVTRAMLKRWTVFAFVVGIAQLFRTTVEIIVGVGMLWAAAFLAAAVVTRRNAVAFFGFALLAGWCLARVVSAFWLGIRWHSEAIIVAAWGMFAYLTAERALSAFRIRDEGHNRVGLG